MSFSRKFGLFFTGFIFRSTLFFGLTLLAAVMVLGERDTFKQALVDANAYTRYSQSIIDAGKQQTSNDPAAIPLDDPRVTEIIKESLDKKSLKSISEKAVDSGYDWLEGKTDKIVFSADVSQNKKLLAEETANYAVERLVNLPVCTEIPAETNVFRISCYPFNTNINMVKSEVYETLMNDKSIFARSTITADNLPKTADGQRIDEAYDKAPFYFTLLKISPWILLSVAAGCSLAFVWLSRTKKRGIQAVSTSIIGTGVVLAVAPIIYTYILPAAGLSLPGTSASGNESINGITSDVMKYVYGEFNATLINIAIQTVTAGVILYIASRFLVRNRSVYNGLSKKTGLAISIDDKTRRSGPKVTSKDVPVQTSERK